jgi:hypothetical protein
MQNVMHNLATQMDKATSQPRIETERPRYPAAITEDLLTGSRRLRHAPQRPFGR